MTDDQNRKAGRCEARGQARPIERRELEHAIPAVLIIADNLHDRPGEVP